VLTIPRGFIRYRDAGSMSAESQSEKCKNEVELERLKVERYKVDRFYEVASKVIDAFKEYYLKTARIILLSAWIIICIIFIVTACLTYLGKVGGETFSFIAGTIVGYIISLLGAKK